jgi:trk/ktr system potassium uptake protein
VTTPSPRRRRIPPPVFLAAAMGATILVGAILLRLPISHAAAPVGFLDALFTATSAVCVTGLAVVDTGSRYSFFGQAVILVLIQVGGLGIMTISTVVLVALGQRPTTVVRELLKGFAGHIPTIRARVIFGGVFLVTILVELTGATLLLFEFVSHHPLGEAVWMALFHSVSAFCNAGFSLYPDSFVRYSGSLLVNLTTMGLIIAGGLGFVVLVELRGWLTSQVRRSGQVNRLTLHTKIVLSATAVAIFGGALMILVLEWNHTLAHEPLQTRFLIAAFQSVTARTAGYNTVDIGSLTNPTLLILILLMFVGAGPGSMAGGIKLTSATAVLALVYHRLRNNPEVRVFGRAIGEATLQRAVVLAILAAVLIGAAVCAIEIAHSNAAPSALQRGHFFAVTFEAVSAFGTVGLSMGITSALDSAAKLIIIFLMYVGRLGPLWLMDFLYHLPAAPPIRHAREELMVG